MGAGAIALLNDATSGAGGSPPTMERLCIPHHCTPARAAFMDTVVVRPAGTVLNGWPRTGPHARSAQLLVQGWDSVCLIAARRMMTRAAGVTGRTVVTRRERGSDTYS